MSVLIHRHPMLIDLNSRIHIVNFLLVIIKREIHDMMKMSPSLFL